MISVDIHILQTVPPSNINRDDTGSPKTATFGGVLRARVSSQAWKRATRNAFAEHFPPSDLGVRTKRVVELLANEIGNQDPARTGEVAQKLAAAALTAVDIKLTTPKVAKGRPTPPEESGYLLFLARHQIAALAELAITADDAGTTIDKRAAKAAADTHHSVDVALFGRMVADDSTLNVDAAAQVAHALSVHSVANEYDYFTAVDDAKEGEDETGAGMIGTVEFNSSTLYRYATVNVTGLLANLGTDEATARAVQEFVRAFVTSMPTGKQNTFANRTLPEAVVVQVRDTQPVNLVGAFEEPVVVPAGVGRLNEAASRLAAHAQRIDEAYGTTPIESFVVLAAAAAEPLSLLGRRVSLGELVEALGETVRGQLLPGTTVPA